MLRHTERDSMLQQRGGGRKKKKKLLKFIGRKKESTVEYITQHQLFQGHQRSDCLSGTMSGSQWHWWNHTGQGKSGIKSSRVASVKPIHTISDGCVASLHHCPHVSVCVWNVWASFCGTSRAFHTSHWPIFPLPPFKIASHATPQWSPSLGCSDLW